MEDVKGSIVNVLQVSSRRAEFRVPSLLVSHEKGLKYSYKILYRVSKAGGSYSNCAALSAIEGESCSWRVVKSLDRKGSKPTQRTGGRHRLMGFWS